MELDLELCKHYLSSDTHFWEIAQQGFDVLHTDPLFQTSFKNLQSALERHDLVQAQQICSACFSATRATHDDERLAYLAPCILLALCLPQGLSCMRALGADERMILDTLRDFERWETISFQKTGKHGIADVGWLLYPYVGRLIQIGRLQYEPYLYPLPYALYRHRSNGQTLCLCIRTLYCDPAGRPLEGNEAETDGFQTTFFRSDGYITATQADPFKGVFLRDPIQIRTEEWELLLIQGQPVYNLHVPRCGPLYPSDVDASLRVARTFFSKQNQRPFIAVCDSWLLDPALAGISNENSNIIRFMQRFSKYPVGQDSCATDYLFPNASTTDLAELSKAAKTSMQRKCLSYLRQGGRLCDTGGFLVLPYADV